MLISSIHRLRLYGRVRFVAPGRWYRWYRLRRAMHRTHGMPVCYREIDHTDNTDFFFF